MNELIDSLYDIVEIRRVICSTNARGAGPRGPPATSDQRPGLFPTEQAALKCLYLVTRSLDPSGRGEGAMRAMRWKQALNAFAITFNGRYTSTGTWLNAKVRSAVYQTVPETLDGGSASTR